MIEHARGSQRDVVLVVDDDPDVRRMMHMVLERSGFTVEQAGSGAEALDAYQRLHGAVRLVLLDVRMPRMDGPQTLDRLRELNPRVRCCFMTGDPGSYSDHDLLARGAERVLRKPFVLAAVRELLTASPNQTVRALSATADTNPVRRGPA